ncbi:DUF1330 domain-containing protein [Nocardioides sp. SOB77]|uniref:DUF1330 domain-containing protein n=1 Tax=Nocardioides oceani TaxID=3058369 RepID=A0ABT8FHT5_9ACTN|nr:DUF1330 domain-containing protein [Nocardioides oceani]MDN4174000.1 DUF1330 domain-containing protein [Nocardioides oceani]
MHTTETDPRTARAYAVAYLRDVSVGPAIIDYLQRIDESMAPYGGRFLVHGGALTPLEGTWDGDVVVLEFPDVRTAQDWYASPAYQAILPLRTENSSSIACVVQGVPVGYRATHKLDELVGRGATA